MIMLADIQNIGYGIFFWCYIASGQATTRHFTRLTQYHKFLLIRLLSVKIFQRVPFSKDRNHEFLILVKGLGKEFFLIPRPFQHFLNYFVFLRPRAKKRSVALAWSHGKTGANWGHFEFHTRTSQKRLALYILKQNSSAHLRENRDWNWVRNWK